ncbi:DUF6268 family outer membrane beta-barrel protein [Dokdonella sp.]|uniref:DUF6268 family outer membrane beta-barrel protein n=1 Tax=Dokdonella sp. TaxID=2291710 RepID=UPI001B00750F|nr:DUF6268 family outer membrane beta-barrel protein [Dokdonella sp.]MBO9661920.1 hypothetical protein [Dokdonella sp.]
MNIRIRHRRRYAGARVGTLAVVLFAAALPASPSRAAEPGPDDWNGSLSGGALFQPQADLDDGGKVGRSSAALAVSAQRRFGAGLSIGGSLRYEYEKWDFDQPAAFGGGAPWKNVRRLGVAVQVRSRLNDRWDLIVAPMAQYAGEQDAKSSDALRYGSAFAVARQFGPDLRAGFGVVVLHDIEKNRVLPYLDVSWKIDEHWRLGSAKAAMPTSLGALELVYRRDPRWSLGLGAGFGDNRFRLDEHGPMAGGVVESKSTPLYAHLSFRPDPALSLDAYLGATFRNELRIERKGLRDVTQKYDAAPIVGFSASFSP